MFVADVGLLYCLYSILECAFQQGLAATFVDGVDLRRSSVFFLSGMIALPIPPQPLPSPRAQYSRPRYKICDADSLFYSCSGVLALLGTLGLLFLCAPKLTPSSPFPLYLCLQADERGRKNHVRVRQDRGRPSGLQSAPAEAQFGRRVRRGAGKLHNLAGRRWAAMRRGVSEKKGMGAFSRRSVSVGRVLLFCCSPPGKRSSLFVAFGQ